MNDQSEVTDHLHVRVGDRYRITERWAAKLAAAHCSPEYIAARRTGGVAECITKSERWEWVTVRIRLDQPPVHVDGTGDAIEVADPVDLEPIPGPPAHHLENDPR